MLSLSLSVHLEIYQTGEIINTDLFRNKDVDVNTLAESYKSNTPKEKLVLSFCENFRRQFVHLYRDRKPLLLNPLNECGIEVTACLYFYIFGP